MAAQSPKAAVAYAVSQAEMVLARKLDWSPAHPVWLSTAVPVLKSDPRYNADLVEFLEYIDGITQDMQSVG